MNDDQYFLANGYLDGELTADERRIAETDPAVMAEVEKLRDLQAALRAVDAPTAGAREAAISAAMAQFAPQEAVTEPQVAAQTPVIPFRPRPAYSRYLGIAAAVVGVGLLGAVIVNGIGGGSDDDSAATAELAGDEAADQATGEATADRTFTESINPTVPANASAAAADEAEDSAEMSEEMSEDDAAEMADDAGDDMSADMAEEATGQPAASQPAGADMPADGSEFGGDVDLAYDTTSNGVIERPDIDVEAPITNDSELGAYGTYLLEQQNDGVLQPTPNTACDAFYNILDDTLAVINDVEVDVYIAVQEAEERVLAIDRDDCVPLVDGPLFPPNNG